MSTVYLSYNISAINFSGTYPQSCDSQYFPAFLAKKWQYCPTRVSRTTERCETGVCLIIQEYVRFESVHGAFRASIVGKTMLLNSPLPC